MLLSRKFDMFFLEDRLGLQICAVADVIRCNSSSWYLWSNAI